ncbi:MAG: oligosaccharide flippase family protein [Bacilli bacterium]|nr:oligosaccharide flippase family protein [Bacilli bacterium]
MKNKFVRTTIALIIGGFITKLFSLILKIILTRSIDTETLGLYMTLTPTLMLMINLSQAGFPTAISKLVSEDNRNRKNLMLSIFPILAILNITIMILIFISAPTLTKLLQNKNLYLGIISIALVIPFTSISSIIRSYLFGTGKTFPHILSNIVESIIRLILYKYYLPIVIKKKISYIIGFLILSNVLAEISSIITMMIFLPKHLTFQKRDFLPKSAEVKDSLEISIPVTITSLIGSIGYFLEPIILMNTLKLVGYKTSYINYEYGIITGYVIPLILMPSFFTQAISQALLPSISKDYTNHKIKSVKRKIKFAILLSLLIGGIFTFLFVSTPNFYLEMIYHTSVGVNYIRILSPIFLFYYIALPISSSLDAMGKSKDHMKTTLSATIIRSLTLFLFSLFHIGLYSLLIATSVNILYTTIKDYQKLKTYLK